MEKVLVIGAGGQVGSGLIPVLRQRGQEVIAADRVALEDSSAYDRFERLLQAAELETLRRSWRVLDAGDDAAVRRLVRDEAPHVVYHLAAILSGKGEEDPVRCWKVNLDGLLNVLDSMESLGTDRGARRKVIWPSSVAAFGPAPGTTRPYVVGNDDALFPNSVYGATKVAGEALGTYYDQRRGVDFRSLRFPGLINETPPGGGSSDYANEMYFGAVEGQSTVTFARPETRMPFMHMDDAIRGLVALAEADKARLTRRVYNVSALSPSALEIAESIRAEIPGFEVAFDPTLSPARVENVDSWPDEMRDELAREDWGWDPEIATLDDLTRRLLRDIRATLSATT